MAPPKLTIPESAAEDWAIWRGDDWDQKLLFHTDLSAYEFAGQLKHSRFGDVVATLEWDTTHQADDPETDDPYVIMHLDGAVTALIEENLLYGDVQTAQTRTMFRFTVPVFGQYTELESA